MGFEFLVFFILVLLKQEMGSYFLRVNFSFFILVYCCMWGSVCKYVVIRFVQLVVLVRRVLFIDLFVYVFDNNVN